MFINEKGSLKDLRLAPPLDLTLFIKNEYLDDLIRSLSIGQKLKKYDFFIICKLILTNLIKNYDGFSLSLNNNKYSALPDRYNKFKVSSYKLREVLKVLENHNYIEIYKGFHGTQYSYLTRILSSHKFKNFLKTHQIHSFNVAYDFNRERIILKDSHKNFIDYQDNKFINRQRNTLIDYERFLEKNSIKLNNYRLNISFKRIFNDSSFKSGGRIYASYQNLQINDRLNFKINNKDVCEIDFKGLHIQLLYLKKGLELYKGDPYLIDGYEDYRDDFKIALQIALNAPNLKSAYGGMNQVLKDKPIKAKKLLELFSKKHKNISEYFFSGIGLHLQNEDSVIVDKIIQKALKEKIVVLPVHDSFIVSKDDKDFIINSLKEISLNTYKCVLPLSEKTSI